MDIDGTGKLSKSLKAINHLLSPATRSSSTLARQHDYWLIFILLIARGAASVGGLFRFWWKRERQQRFCEALLDQTWHQNRPEGLCAFLNVELFRAMYEQYRGNVL